MRGLRAAQSLAVDLGAIAFFAFLLRRDLKARDKQVRLADRCAD